MNCMVTFVSSDVVHAADSMLQPVCHQTCRRCLSHIQRKQTREPLSLRLVVAHDEVEIWWEDILCLGSGPTLHRARMDVLGTLGSILRELPELTEDVDLV